MNTFPAVHNYDSVFVDTNVIVNFVRSDPTGSTLNELIIDGNTTYVTFTVEQELRANLTGSQFAQYQQWAYANYANGNMGLVPTYTPSGRNMGEQSIRDALNDPLLSFGNSLVLTGDSGETFGSADILNSLGFANSLLLSGEISYARYGVLLGQIAAVAPHELVGPDGIGVALVPGMSYDINGVIVEIRPNGLIVNGIHVSPLQKFEIDPSTGEVTVIDDPSANNHCFLGDTPIQMWPLDPSIKPRADGSYDEVFVLSKVWEKPISEIKVGDIVVAYDDKGRLGPKRVLHTMENCATHILDFWGTGTTPGHAYHCADGPNKGGHAPIMDILRMDGAIMRADGTMIRAATNCKVGSMGDMMIHASATLQKPDGSWTEPKRGKVRFGTRIILPDGRHMSFMEMAASEGWRVSDDGYMVGMMKGEDGEFREQKFLFPYAHDEELPKPEAYILARSAVILEEIYAAGEWEQIGTRLPAPAGMVGLNTNHTSTLLQPSKPEPNIPPAFAGRPDAPRRSQGHSMNRKQRKAMEAKQRKAAKSGRRIAG